MDLPHASTFWGSCLGESSSVAGDSDEDFRRQSEFSVGYDSEEEQRHEMEESLYCQMYFKANSEKSAENSEEESNYHMSDLSNSDLPSTMHRKENKLNAVDEEVKDTKRRRNEDCTDMTKTNKKLKKSRMVSGTRENSDEKLLPNKSSENETVSSTIGRIPDESFINSSEVVLVPTDSEKSEISSNSEPYLVEDESEQEDSAQKPQPGKCKKSRKMREVIDVRDTSSDDSSLFLDISSDDDDINVHMVKSLTAGDQAENDEHLQAILNSLPAECNWKINNTDRLGSSCGEKSRYYNSTSKLRCNNCNQRGHFRHACPEPKKVNACILCGNRGHLPKYCSQSLCFRCNRPGHTAKECDRKRSWQEDACHRCGLQGHFESDCPDCWRQYHLTIISSEIVKGPKLENHRKFCYNCAAVGHFGHECRRRRDNYGQPFIMKYDKNHDRRGQAKDSILQNESLSACVASKESFLVEHIESKCQSDRKRCSQTERQCEGKTLQQSNEMNQEPLEYNRRKEYGKDNSFQLSSFARKIKDKLLDTRKLAKKRPRKPKKVKDVLQLDYLPLTTDVSGSEAHTFNSFQRSAELLSEMKSSSSNVISVSKSMVSRTSLDGLYVGDFPRSNVKTWQNQNSVEFYRKKEDSRFSNCSASKSVGYYSQLQFTSPKELKTASNRFINCRKSEWQQTSTPVGRVNRHQQQSPEFSTSEACSTWRRRRSRELCTSEMQQLEEDQILGAYYSKNHIKNERRKERKKKKQALLALDKANVPMKSSGRQSRRKRKSTDRGVETERGFRIAVL